MIRIATQDEINQFYLKAMSDPDVGRFLSIGTYIEPPKTDGSTWNRIILIDNSGNSLGSISVDRSCRNDCNISIWTLNPKRNKVLSGKMMYAVRAASQSFDPKYINSLVLVTNSSSMRITERLLGKPWGIEPDAGWDSGISKWVDVAHFRCPIETL